MGVDPANRRGGERLSSSVLDVSLELTVLPSPKLQRDAALDTSIPTLVTNSTNWGGLVDAAFVNSSLLWNAIPSELANDWNGFSLLVDDVERYVGTETSQQHMPSLLRVLWTDSSALASPDFSFVSLSPLFPHFFRLAVRPLPSQPSFPV